MLDLWKDVRFFVGGSNLFSFFLRFGANFLLRRGTSKTTVAQKCSGAMEIQKYDGPTNGLTWVGARDTCVSKNRIKYALGCPLIVECFHPILGVKVLL